MPTTASGIDVPAFMYGTAWKKEETRRLTILAVENGFKAIDTANQIVHYNEALVGDALVELYKQGVKREDLFLQTKFTSVGGQRGQTPYDASAPLTTQVEQSIMSSFEHLHTDFLDSYVLHGPYHRYKLGKEDWEVWTAMEAAYNAGQTRMLGVSNVTAEQLQELCIGAKVKPMMVQNRCYAIMGWDQEVREICRANNIIYQGFSLLTANADLLNTHTMHKIAERLGAGVAQVVFAFAMQIGMLPLTGTTNARRMQDDLAAEKFKLTAEEIEAVLNIASR